MGKLYSGIETKDGFFEPSGVSLRRSESELFMRILAIEVIQTLILRIVNFQWLSDLRPQTGWN